MLEPLANRNFRQMDVLHHSPHDGQTTRLGRKGINLISPLPHIAEKAFNRIGAANVAIHDRAGTHKTLEDALHLHRDCG